MKRILALIIGLLAITLSVWLWFYLTGEGDVPLPPKPGPVAPVLPPPTNTTTDAIEVFQRAFWKRPTETDHILHAERREWADEEGVDRWQWFIAVEPSDELARYLNEQNPFSLIETSGEIALPVQPIPKWFPAKADGFTARQSQDGQMLILSDLKTGHLYATSQGRGFAKPVDVMRPSAPASRSSGNPGRLPTTPPPVPEER
jgi:hypothetical protein